MMTSKQERPWFLPIFCVWLLMLGAPAAAQTTGYTKLNVKGRVQIEVPDNRSFLVFVQGVGLGIPFVALFTQLFAYRRLTKTGTTLWDTSASAAVFHKKWGVLRALACTTAVFGVLILMSALNAAGNR